MPEIPFVFAGSGDLENLVNTAPNVENVGFFVRRGAEQKNCGSPIYDFPIRMLRKLSLQRNGVCF